MSPTYWLDPARDLTGIPSFENISNLDFLSIFITFSNKYIFTYVSYGLDVHWFAMVVFSAAIKAIPSEIIEAGQMDGATEGKIFLSIVIPYLKTTILVVATYLTVSVLKAFDIVYVTTRGDFETNLLAVKMLDEFAIYLNQGRSATVAVLILYV